MVCVGLSVLFSGYAFRYARYINQNYSNPATCSARMSNIDQDELIAIGCSSKYVYNPGTNTLLTQCPNSQIGTYWENDVGVNANLQTHQTTCLNMACCGLLGQVYSSTTYNLAIISLATLIMAGMVSIGCYYFWYVHFYASPHKNNLNEYTWVILMGILLFTFIFVYSLVPAYYPRQYGQNVVTQITPPQNIVSINASQIGENACYSLQQLTSLNFNMITHCAQADCSVFPLAMSITASNSYFNTANIPTEIIDFSDPKTKNVVWPKAGANDAYISMYAPPMILQTALANLYVCPNVPANVQVQYLIGSTPSALTNQAPTSFNINAASTGTQTVQGVVRVENYQQFTFSALGGVTVTATRQNGYALGSTTTDSSGRFSLSMNLFPNRSPYIVVLTFTASGYGTKAVDVQVGGAPSGVTTVDVGSVSLIKSISNRLLQTAPTGGQDVQAVPDPVTPTPPPAKPVAPAKPKTPTPTPSPTPLPAPKLPTPPPAPKKNPIPAPIPQAGPLTPITPFSLPWLLAQVQIVTVDAITLQPVQYANVELYQQSDVVSSAQVKPAQSAFSDYNGNVQFSNVPAGYYLLNITVKGYVPYTLPFDIYGSIVPFSVPLVQIVQPGTFIATLEWLNSVDLDLMVSFIVDSVTTCQVDPTLAQCGNVIHSTNNAIKVNNWGPYYYLFFVRKSQGIDMYSNNTIPLSYVQLDNGGTHLKVYVDGVNTQAAFDFHPPTTLSDNDSMIWLGFCVNGNVGPASLVAINTYWSSQGASQTPTSALCNQYYQ
jgi:hypothetical protein